MDRSRPVTTGRVASTTRVSASNTSCPAPKRALNCSESRVHLRWMSSDNSITGPIAVDATWISHARFRSHRIANARGTVSAHASKPWLRRITAGLSPIARISRGPSSAWTVMPSKSWYASLPCKLRRIEIRHRQPALRAGDRHARGRVRMHHAVRAGNARRGSPRGSVKPAGFTGHSDLPMTLPCEVDLHQVRRRHLRVEQAERIDEEVLVGPGRRSVMWL